MLTPPSPPPVPGRTPPPVSGVWAGGRLCTTRPAARIQGDPRPGQSPCSMSWSQDGLRMGTQPSGPGRWDSRIWDMGRWAGRAGGGIGHLHQEGKVTSVKTAQEGRENGTRGETSGGARCTPWAADWRWHPSPLHLPVTWPQHQELTPLPAEPHSVPKLPVLKSVSLGQPHGDPRE